MMTSKELLLKRLNDKYQTVEQVLQSVPKASEDSLRSILEACVKLVWLIKFQKDPDSRDFSLAAAIKHSDFTKLFTPLIISDMNIIKELGNDSTHNNVTKHVEGLTANELIELFERLKKIIRETEKVLGFSIINLIQEEVISPSNPVSTPAVEKKSREKVKHARFGDGEIISIKGDTIKVLFGVTIKEFPYPSSINNGTLIRLKTPSTKPNVSAPHIQATNVPSQKHRWTFDEDKTCCRMFIETYITNHTSCSLDSLATKILSIYSNMKFSSVKMKLQNIKRICLDYGIKDSSTISPLDNYSNQNLRAMRESLQQIGITI